MASDDPNAGLFSGDEPGKDPEEEFCEFTFGKNPNRTSALFDLFAAEMMSSVEEDEDLPEEAKKSMIFKMTANSVLDMVMECVGPDVAEEVASSFDAYVGMCLVNKKFDVNLIGEMQKAMIDVEQEQGEDDESYERRLSDMENSWWDIPQPRLDKRNPNDAIRETLIRYGLNG